MGFRLSQLVTMKYGISSLPASYHEVWGFLSVGPDVSSFFVNVVQADPERLLTKLLHQKRVLVAGKVKTVGKALVHGRCFRFIQMENERRRFKVRV